MENKAYEKDQVKEDIIQSQEVENDLNKSSSPLDPQDSPPKTPILSQSYIEETPHCLSGVILKIPTREKCDLENNREVEEEEEEEEEEEDEERRCGLFDFYPKCLQRHANPMAFLFVFSIQNILQGATFSLMVSSSTSLERHFRFSSKDLGSLIMLGEIGPMLLSLVVSHLGGKSNRPRFMGRSLALVALGLFVGFLTFLVYPPPVLTESGQLKNSKKFCRPQDVASYLIHGSTTVVPPSSSPAVGDSCSHSNSLAYFMWFLSFTLNAVGATSIYTVGAPYLDDSIEKKEAPIYFAISIAVRVLGPLVGFSLSSVLLTIYVYPGSEYGLTPEDPRWIGAWWIGSLVFSIITFFYSFVIALFPRKMRTGKVAMREETNQQDLQKKDTLEDATVKDSLKKFLKEIRSVMVRLLRNKVIVHSTIADFFGYNAVAGIFFWLPKYLEHQFRVDKSTAALYTGIAGTSSIILGVLGGGVFISQLRPSARLLAKLLVVLTAIYTISVGAMMFITCDFNDDLPGTLSKDGMSVELNRSCSAGCRCDLQEFIPVCVENERANTATTFFSPCHAGCPDVPLSDDSTYMDCSCGRKALGLRVRPGYCRKTCSGFLTYNILNVVIKSFISFGSIGGVLISLRCVAVEDKAVALGFKTTILALATFVNPLIFGSLADSSCLVWEESCNQTGACWVYDTRMFGYRLHGTAAVLLVVCTFFLYLMARNIGDLQLFDEPRLSPAFSSFTNSARTWKNQTLSFFSRHSTVTRENSVSSSSSSSRRRKRDDSSTDTTTTALEDKITLAEEALPEEGGAPRDSSERETQSSLAPRHA